MLSTNRQKVAELTSHADRLSKESDEVLKNMNIALENYNLARKKYDSIENEKLPLEQRLRALKQNVTEQQHLEIQGDRLLHDFMQLSEKCVQHCKQLPQEYATHWNTKEQVWFYWNVDDIAAWVIYKIDTNDVFSHKFNLAEKKSYLINIRAKLQDMKYHGSYLRAVTYNKLKEIGFNRENNENIRDWLYKEIHAMCDKYPMPIENSHDGNNGINGELKMENDLENEDERFLCPLSGELMNDPVIAMDGNTYEKEEIINYLRRHGDFPRSVNGEKCANIELAIGLLRENIPLKQEIERKYGCQPPPAKKQRMSK